MTERTGRCLCGAVSFRLSAEPLTTRICWCTTCQHLAGNGTVNAMVPSNALEISGELSSYSSAADSGNEIVRRFCPRCGTHLFANAAARPLATVVRVGNFDEPSSLRPVSNIWASSAPAWACLDDSLQRVDKQPAPPPGAGAPRS